MTYIICIIIILAIFAAFNKRSTPQTKQISSLEQADIATSTYQRSSTASTPKDFKKLFEQTYNSYIPDEVILESGEKVIINYHSKHESDGTIYASLGVDDYRKQLAIIDYWKKETEGRVDPVLYCYDSRPLRDRKDGDKLILKKVKLRRAFTGISFGDEPEISHYDGTWGYVYAYNDQPCIVTNWEGADKAPDSFCAIKIGLYDNIWPQLYVCYPPVKYPVSIIPGPLAKNDQPGQTKELRSDIQCQIIGEEYAQDTIQKYQAGDIVWCEVSRGSIDKGKNKGKPTLNFFLDGAKVGQLTAQTATKYVDLIPNSGTACYAIVKQGKTKLEIVVRLPY